MVFTVTIGYQPHNILCVHHNLINNCESSAATNSIFFILYFHSEWHTQTQFTHPILYSQLCKYKVLQDEQPHNKLHIFSVCTSSSLNVDVSWWLYELGPRFFILYSNQKLSVIIVKANICAPVLSSILSLPLSLSPHQAYSGSCCRTFSLAVSIFRFLGEKYLCLKMLAAYKYLYWIHEITFAQ